MKRNNGRFKIIERSVDGETTFTVVVNIMGEINIGLKECRKKRNAERLLQMLTCTEYGCHKRKEVLDETD